MSLVILLLSSGTTMKLMVLSNKYLDNYLVDCHEICYRYPRSLEDE